MEEEYIVNHLQREHLIKSPHWIHLNTRDTHLTNRPTPDVIMVEVCLYYILYIIYNISYGGKIHRR